MSYNARTDLALEAREMYYESSVELEAEIKGVEVENEEMEENIKITRVKIISEEGVRALGKEKGNYITLEIPLVTRGSQSEYEDWAMRLYDVYTNAAMRLLR